MVGKIITKTTTINFQIKTFGLYAVSITARCQSGKLLGLRGGENLRVEIDDIQLREVPSEDKPQYVDIPPTWNGTELKGLAKTVIFILALDKGDHTLKFVPTPSATIETYTITPIQNPQDITLTLNNQAEDGNRRPWYTFVLVNLPLQSLSADITVDWHLFDGDDVKLVVDGNIEENAENKHWKNWIWHATLGQIFSGAKREKKTFTKQLLKGIHYIELWADKKPTLHSVNLNLGDYTPKRIPTVEDPRWTGDFSDDTEQILLARLILGEMEGQSQQAKIGAGFTVLNRFRKKRSHWGYTLHEIILKDAQYDAFWNEDTTPKVKNPLDHVSRAEWENCYKIAGQILSGAISDPTSGATHFYSIAINSDFPSWATDDVYKTKIGITYFYELER